ncbi:MAG: hypothetical protein ACI9QL_003945 [Candidatus Omnitrophota bacterium]|jgi:hypothetical protein
MEPENTHTQILNQATYTLFTMDDLRSIESAIQ